LQYFVIGAVDPFECVFDIITVSGGVAANGGAIVVEYRGLEHEAEPSLGDFVAYAYLDAVVEGQCFAVEE
jgi:hypothetical protein